MHLIVNPSSGYGGQNAALSRLRHEARLDGIAWTEHVTRGPWDARDYARSVARDASAIIVLGGDGTVSEVVNGLGGATVPILPCPAGTENLLAKELRIPSDPGGILHVLRRGREVECDVGYINDQRFLLIIGVGFDGEVVRRLTAGRTGHISHLSYFWPIWRTFWEHDFPKMRIIADGEEILDDYGLAFIGNISRYAVGLRICRDAAYDDGLLDLVVFHCRRQTRLMLHAAWTLLRRHPLKGDVTYRQFRRLRIEADRKVATQVDGDVGPVAPLEIGVCDHTIHLLVPEPPATETLWPWKKEQLT